jgi:hypothetical protein
MISVNSRVYARGQEEAGGMYTLMIQRVEPLRGVEIAIASMTVLPRRRGEISCPVQGTSWRIKMIRPSP